MEREITGTIAVIEDEIFEREGMAMFIRDTFPHLTILWTAADGEEALEKARQEAPDVMIVDIEMPVRNGLSLCEELKKDGYGGVILIHTAYASFAYARQAIALNVFDYILKPVSDDELRDALIRCFEEAARRCEAKKTHEELSHVVEDVRQYAMSLMTLDTMDIRQRELFLKTVGWPGGPLKTFIVCLREASPFTPDEMKLLKDQKAWGSSHGFLLSGDYMDVRHYLLLVQPVKETEGTRLYTLVWLYLRLMQKKLPHAAFACEGPCGDFDTIASTCRRMHKEAAPAPKEGEEGAPFKKSRVRMADMSWRLIPRRYMEKYYSTFCRYLMDGAFDRASRYIARIRDEDGDEEKRLMRFWEIVPLCFSAAVEVFGSRGDAEEWPVWDRLFDEGIRPEEWLEDYFAAARPGDAEPEDGDALSRLLSWMRSSLQGEVSMAAAAEKMGMANAYFSRYFKKQMGRNFSDVLTGMRLEHCEELLKKDKSLSLEELAGACGFGSKSYFCEVFKKWKGMTVTQYVRELEKEG